MSEYTWTTVYADALATFGADPPSAQLEADILAAFKQHPQAVINAIAKVGKQYKAGTIRSPWGVLKTEIPKQVKADITASPNRERQHKTERAEQWMRNAGREFPTWDEVDDELFGDRGHLKTIADDVLRQRFKNLWQSLQPVEEAA